ncbi:DNA-binding protein [Bowmanella denitrificans]|uniref:DNA-binding protein n=1 Tax=Bowmanella denitrificans TaxID=366582 RepID=UPI000C9B97C0|nr:DNA-binding protein [Bowmanella denitrificans]
MATQKTRTAEQVKKDFEARGETIAHWAKAQGFPEHTVYQVLNGFAKGKRGMAHQIAVRLGIKAEPTRANAA